jgi:hypothetical protein
LVVAAVAVVVTLSLVACSGAPGTTQPGATQQPGGVPTQPITTQAPGGATGHECDAFPTFSIENPNPSFAADPALAAKFPTQIDGQPAQDLTTGYWAAFLCMLGQQSYSDAVADMPPGFNYSALSYGSATYTIDGADIGVTAYRIAGQDANGIVAALAQLAAATGGEAGFGTLASGTVAGKNVYTWTDEDGSSYGYVSGDTLFTIESGTSVEQATTIIAALP